MADFADLRPLADWHEDMGDMLWWVFDRAGNPTEAPYVGSPLCLGFTVETEIVCRSRTHMDPQGKQRTLKFNRDVGGWPGYHTHFSEIPQARLAPRAQPARTLESYNG